MEKKIFFKRISAYLIDIMFVFLIISLINEIRFINPNYDKYIESYNAYLETVEDYTNEKITDEEYLELYKDSYYLINKYSISYNIVIVLVIVLYFGVFQRFTNGQTIGKKLMKIRVVSRSDKNLGITNYLLRIIPMYFIYIGGILPIIINSILIFVVNKSTYMNVSMIISYINLFVFVFSVILIFVKKDGYGLHEIISNTRIEEENG